MRPIKNEAFSSEVNPAHVKKIATNQNEAFSSEVDPAHVKKMRPPKEEGRLRASGSGLSPRSFP
jgi:hypothetical protein